MPDAEWRPTREEALDYFCEKSIFMTDALSGERLAAAFDTTLDKIGVAPTRADELAAAPLSSWDPRFSRESGSVRVAAGYQKRPSVFVYQVAAMTALFYGLYGNVDHALSSPYHKPGSECRYISCRSAIRLARHFGGNDMVRGLRERNPWIEENLWREEPFTGTGQRGERLR